MLIALTSSRRRVLSAAPPTNAGHPCQSPFIRGWPSSSSINLNQRESKDFKVKNRQRVSISPFVLVLLAFSFFICRSSLKNCTYLHIFCVAPPPRPPDPSLGYGPPAASHPGVPPFSLVIWAGNRHFERVFAL